MGNGTCTGISVLQITLLLKMQKHVSHDLRYVAVVLTGDRVSTYKENNVPIILSRRLILYLLMLTNLFHYLPTHVIE
jgi:hypothetical protein